MRVSKGKLLATAAVLAVMSGAAQAADLFTLEVTSGGQTGRKAYNRVEDFATADFQNVVNAYTVTSAAQAVGNLRGVAATLSYAANSNTLNFSVPDLNRSVSFTGATRDESQRMLRDWLKANGNDMVRDLLKLLAAKSPIDPVAGNPTSLMSTMGAADFASATSIGRSLGGGGGAPGKSPNIIGLNAGFGQFHGGGYTSSTYTLPLSYALNLDNPRLSVLLDLPLTYADTQGAVSINGSFGVGVRVPVLDNWSLTPAVRAGVAGSVDLGSASGMYSASLTSAYNFGFGPLDFTLGNMIAYYKTQGLSVGGVNIDYALSNMSYRNGLRVGGKLPFDVLGASTTWEVFGIDTRFTGDRLYSMGYDEIGVAFGVPVNVGGVKYDKFKLGASYTMAGRGSNAYKVNFGYKF